MQILLNISLAALACAIVALHILSAVFSTKGVFNYVNIALHIILVAPLLLSGAELELVALVFMSSLLVYLASNLIAASVKRGKGAVEDRERGGE